MKLRNMWMVLSCITCALISLSCPNVKIKNRPNGAHTPNQKVTLEQKEQAKEVASNFISGVFKNDDPRKDVFGAAFEAAFLKNISNNVIKKDISAEAITKALENTLDAGEDGCLYNFINDNDTNGTIIANTIRANAPAVAAAPAAPAAPVAPAAPKAAVEVKSKAEMTEFFDKMIKAGIAKDCFK